MWSLVVEWMLVGGLSMRFVKAAMVAGESGSGGGGGGGRGGGDGVEKEVG